MESLSNYVMVSALLICLYTDLKERKIYNKVTFTLILLGFILNVNSSGFEGVLFSLKGFSLGLSLMFIPFILGGIGAGDVKLIMAIGAVKGATFVLSATIATFLAGGIVALVLLIRKGVLLSTLRQILSNIKLISLGQFGPGSFRALSTSTAITFPYGIAIFVGTISTLLVV